MAEELMEHGDFSAAISYDNPKFTATIRLEAFEIEPKELTVGGQIPTAALPEGTKTKPRKSTVVVASEEMREPDKARIEAGLVVPEQQQNPTSGEISDFKPNVDMF